MEKVDALVVEYTKRTRSHVIDNKLFVTHFGFSACDTLAPIFWIVDFG